MYSYKFRKAIPMLLKHEGGYVDHPNDPGGRTKYGISQRSYPHLNIRTLTIEQAKDIYFNDWWKKYSYESFEMVVGEKVMDMAVNMGARRAHKLLQRAANTMGCRLVVDGLIGPKTRSAINALNGHGLRMALREEQKNFYLRIIARRPKFKVFEKGWLRRAAS